MHSVMNNTKWRELQMAMINLQEKKPYWRTRCITNGYVSNWDGDWHYHFSEGGFKDIEWVELKVKNEEQKGSVLSVLKSINLPGEVTDIGFMLYGYIDEGDVVDYI